MRKYTDVSLNDIGNSLGGRDHTTILHAIQKVEKERNDRLKGVVDKIEEKLLKT